MKAKTATVALNKARVAVNKNLPAKLDALEKLIELTGSDISSTLKSIKSNLEFVSSAGL